MNKPFLPYNKHNKQLSKNLRNYSTLAEVLLWNELKAGKIKGYKFNRQKPLLGYIVDFYCKKLNLVIEIDGETHISKEEEDKVRQGRLEELGLTFLRFEDPEVKTGIHFVLEKIYSYINEFEKKNGITNPPVSPFARGNA
jgi:very-short-patch-repair endonuclease